MTFNGLLSKLLARCEGSIDRAFRKTLAERDRHDVARGEFTSTLIIDGRATVRAPEDRVITRRLGV